jgi:4-hydroxy-tetrahydrodipicolinate reductase
MQKLVVTGADGRMGRALIEAILDTEDTQLVGATAKDDSPFIGTDAGELIGRAKTGVTVTADLSACVAADVTVIDFTVPVATLAHLKAVAQAQASIVIGTTGLNEEQLAELQSYKDRVAMVFAGNYSVGVNLTLQLLRMAARIIGNTSDIEVIEAHHRHKVDAPSGTALMMGEAVASTLNKELKDCGVFAREGITGEREPGTIGFSTIRGGDIVGEHTVMFASEGERVEISHKASSRQTFARGAVRAAQWLSHGNKTSGLYSMEDVLGF